MSVVERQQAVCYGSCSHCLIIGVRFHRLQLAFEEVNMPKPFEIERLEFTLRAKTNRGTICLPCVSEIEPGMSEVIFNWVPFMGPTEIISTRLVVTLLPEEPGDIETIFVGERESAGNMRFMPSQEVGCWAYRIPKIVRRLLRPKLNPPKGWGKSRLRIHKP